jgi:hypothetical protein
MQLQGELTKAGGERVYKSPFDCLSKTWRNEGIRGMQRGLGPAVSRVGFRRRLYALTLFEVRISSESMSSHARYKHSNPTRYS